MIKDGILIALFSDIGMGKGGKFLLNRTLNALHTGEILLGAN